MDPDFLSVADVAAIQRDQLERYGGAPEDKFEALVWSVARGEADKAQVAAFLLRTWLLRRPPEARLAPSVFPYHNTRYQPQNRPWTSVNAQLGTR